MRAHVILINALNAMPPKSSKRKRIIQLLNARNSKRNKVVSSTNEPEFTQEEVTSLIDYQSSEDESYEPSIEDMEEDGAVRLHSDEWLNSLHRGDIISLTLLLHNMLVTRMHLSQTKAAKLIGETIKKSDRTVREWRIVFLRNSNNFPDSLEGRDQ